MTDAGHLFIYSEICGVCYSAEVLETKFLVDIHVGSVLMYPCILISFLYFKSVLPGIILIGTAGRIELSESLIAVKPY